LFPFFARTFFVVSISVFFVFHSSVLFCFLCIFYVFSSLAGPAWGAAQLRCPGGLQAHTAELALPLSERFFAFSIRFYKCLIIARPCPCLEKYASPQGRSGGVMEKDNGFYTFPIRLFLPFSWRFLDVFSTYSTEENNNKMSAHKMNKTRSGVFYIH
jgi:hypothetical protein